MKKILLVNLFTLTILLLAKTSSATVGNFEEGDSSKVILPKWKFGGYVDAYYAFYSDSIGAGIPQQYAGVSPTSNAFSLNTALLTGEYESDNVRATLGFMYGDLPLNSWITNYNMVLEANAGVKLFKNFWVDAGFFQSHIGAEWVLPKDNLVSSWAALSYAEAGYQSGICLNYIPSEKLEFNLYFMNGYGIFEETNDQKSLGLLVNYQLNDNVELVYNNYYGDDSPESDSLPRTRFYNNIILNYSKGKNKIQAAIAHAVQSNADIETGMKAGNMFGGLITIKHQLKEKLGIYGRWDIYDDSQGFMSGSFYDSQNRLTGVKQWGATAGIEFKPTEFSFLRLEGRRMQFEDNQKIFKTNNEYTNIRLELMLNLGILL